MKKQLMFGVVAVLLVGFVAVSAFATPFGGKEKKMMQDEDLVAALETGDYYAYIEALEESDRAFMAEHMNEEVFDFKVAMFQEMQERREVMEQVREQAKAAVEAEDHDAWIEAFSDLDQTPYITEVITEENFPILVELHNAKQSEDWETVKELSEELGLQGHGKMKAFGKGYSKGFGHGFGKGFRMGGGFDCQNSEE